MLLLLLSVYLSSPQIISTPMFSFERFEWGQTVDQIRSRLVGKQLHGGPTSTNPFTSRESNVAQFTYDDTCFGRWVGISLMFAKSTNHLTRIMVAFIGINPKTGKLSPTVHEEIDSLWNAFSEHYGKAQKTQKDAMFGEEVLWRRTNTIIRMLRSTVPKPLFMLSYEQD